VFIIHFARKRVTLMFDYKIEWFMAILSAVSSCSSAPASDVFVVISCVLCVCNSL
jgi:hypothetical protein